MDGFMLLYLVVLRRFLEFWNFGILEFWGVIFNFVRKIGVVCWLVNSVFLGVCLVFLVGDCFDCFFRFFCFLGVVLRVVIFF